MMTAEVTKLDRIRNEKRTMKEGRAMAMEVQGRRRRGRPKIRWLGRVRNDIRQMGHSGEEAYDRATVSTEAYVVIHRPHIKVGLR